ncbi:MAG: hypothetical protein PQJ50_11315, partial [Spirochaetales bacterium]|nr:hypothetical protein [Spirochaetales bacterium]
MKKIILAALIALVSFSVFGNGQTDENGGTTLKVVYKEPGGNEAMTKWMTQAKADFEALHPEVTVELSANLSNEADYNTKSALMLQSDSSIDVVHVDSFLVPALVSSGLLAAIPTENWSEYDEQFVQGV